MKISAIVVGILFLCALATPSVAQMSDYEREKIEKLLYADSVKKDLAIFDGTSFNPTGELDTSYRYMVGFINGMNKAVQAINKMTAPARNSDQGRQLIADAQDKLAYSNAMRQAFPSFEKTKKSATSAKPNSTTAPTTTQTTENPNDDVAEISEEQIASIQQHLSTLDSLIKSTHYDGQAFNSALSLQDATAYQSQFLAAANDAARAYNALPALAQRSDTGQLLLRQIKERLDQARQVNGALSNHRAMLQRRRAESINQQQAAEKARREEQAREQAAQQQREAQEAKLTAERINAERAKLAPTCQAFSDAVMSRRNRRAMTAYLQAPDSVLATYKSISRFLTLSDRIVTRCAEPNYAEILRVGCSDNPEDDPKVWCEAAMSARNSIRNHLTRKVDSWESMAESRYMSADELDQQNGWVRIEGPTTFDHVLSFERMIYVNSADFSHEKQRSLFSDLNIKATDFPYYEATLDYIDELREAIEDSVGDWPAVAKVAGSQDNQYGAPLAARQITEQWHPDAEPKGSWLSRSSWKIIRNDLGVILRRTVPGHVLFKLPQDPYCQLRSFTLTEQYTGNGSYQRANGVRFGYVRFQSCDG